LNAQVVVDVDGTILGRYEKVRRVPFGEYVPMRGVLEGLGAPVDQIPRDAVAGTGPAFVELADGTRIGVAISWEIFFSSRVRDGVDHGGEFVMNPTNGSSYTGTILQTQQVASSRLRAVESGRWVVQAAPTGFSAFVDPDGQVHQRTSVSEQAVIEQEIALRDGHTWFQTLGNLPFWFLAAAVLAVSVWMAERARRRGHTSSISVTGPSLSIATSISVRNRPVATVAPSSRSRATTRSTSGSACSGRAAAIQLGRRPALASP
jgi:apolipoprotein N-acyltransferase